MTKGSVLLVGSRITWVQYGTFKMPFDLVHGFIQLHNSV